ncbi:MAG: DUF2971 domain-containing protein [Limisphaerales bacterium]
MSDLLEQKRIWFSSPKYVNDPFEGREGFSSLEDVFAKHPDRNLISKADRVARFAADMYQDSGNDKHGLISFMNSSEIRIQDDPLFWALYADRHKGVRLSFSFELRDVTEADVPVGRLRRVEYQEQPQQYGVKVDDDRLFLKASYWRHENEWRWVSLTSALRSEVYSRRPKQNRDFYLWPGLPLQTIAFGWKSSKIERRNICESLKQWDAGSIPKLLEAVPANSSYTMEYRPYQF